MAGELRIRAAALHDYGWQDRTGCGQPVDPKPAAEVEALLRDLEETTDDVLVLRGIGGAAALDDLHARLPGFSHAHYVPGPTPFEGLAFLSRRPLSSPFEASSLQYRVRGRTHVPTFGSVEIALSDARNLSVWNARLPPGEAEYERRRNEARLLAQSLRPLLTEGREVLLSLDAREPADSPMIRMLEEAGLLRLHPVDSRGDAWTHRDPEGLLYARDQWLFASPALATRLAEAPPSIRDTPGLRLAGPYRHQLLRVPKK